MPHWILNRCQMIVKPILNPRLSVCQLFYNVSSSYGKVLYQSFLRFVGFGRAQGTQETKVIKTLSTKKSFVGIGKPLNDITKPEFDEKGYTVRCCFNTFLSETPCRYHSPCSFRFFSLW
jgi:hypothetical protein